MNLLTKLITTAILTLALVLGGATGIRSNDTDIDMDYAIIKELVASKRSDKFLWDDSYNPNNNLTTRSLANKENTAVHSNFDWTWIDHYIHYSYEKPNFDRARVEFTAKEYQEFVSTDSRGFMVMRVIDYDRDGRADYKHRRFIMVMQNDLVIMPDYPEGYINTEWYKPTQEEADAFLKREMKYWISLAGPEV